MAFSRREFMMGGAALFGGALLGSSRAYAQNLPARRLVLLMARGGWDPVAALDPKEPGPGVSMPDGAIVRRGDLQLYDATDAMGAVPAYFERHGDVTAIVRGMIVASVAHDPCTRRILTGTPSASSPDMGAICAATGGSDLPLPYLVLGAPAFSGPFSAQSGRVGSSNQLVSVLDSTKAFSLENSQGTGFVATEQEASAVQSFLQRRARKVRTQVGAHGNNKRRVDDYIASLTSARELGAFSQVLGDVRPTATMDEQVDTALDMMEQEVVWSVSLDTGVGWDTHTDSHRDQNANNVVMFQGLTRLIDGLKNRPGSMGGRLIDETAVVVVSEMGRTPTLNNDAGKDHWQVTSAMVIGHDVPGERVYGKSTDTGDARGVLQAEPVDYATGQPSPTGRTIEAAEFVAGVVRWTGGNNEEFFPGTTPFMPWAG